MFGKKKKLISELKELTLQSYRAIHTMAETIGIVNSPEVQSLLDKLLFANSDQPIPHYDVNINVRGILDRMPPTWGYHALIDCNGCDKEVITNGDHLNKFVRAMVDKIDMKAYGFPVLAHFATHDPSKGGYTVMQMIETSSIVGHFVDANGDGYIDIFSCKPFSMDAAVELIEEMLKPKKIKARFVRRQA